MAVQQHLNRSNPFAGSEGHFLLPHHENEVARRERHHEFLSSNTHGELIKAPLPSSAGQVRVLDVGCSSGYWLRDVAEQFPNRQLSLHGVDIHDACFPAGEHGALDLRKHDAMLPFPADWSWGESFDLVHQRLMVYSFKKQDWADEVRNLSSLVKPGGWMQLSEVAWLGPEHVTNPAGSPLITKALSMIDWTCSQHEMDGHVASRLDHLLKDAGLVNVERFKYDHGWGAAAALQEWREPSTAIWDISYRHFERKMPTGGIPGVAKTPQEFHDFLDALTDDIRTCGYKPVLHHVIGQKPL